MYKTLEKPDYGLQVAYEILNAHPRPNGKKTVRPERKILSDGCVVIAFPLMENAHRLFRHST